MTVELGCVLGIPLFAAILLALVGHWRAAGTIKARLGGEILVKVW